MKRVLVLALLLAACARRKGPGGHVLFGTPRGGSDEVVDRGSYLEDRNGGATRWIAWKVGASAPGERFRISEELERAEAGARGPLYVIAGVVPDSGELFRVVARPDGSEVKAFALLVPKDAPRPVRWEDHVRKIDEIERATGYDFFPGLPGGVQARLESARNDPAEVLGK